MNALATCPVCSNEAECLPNPAPDAAEIPWLAPSGWVWACGELGYVCGELCQQTVFDYRSRYFPTPMPWKANLRPEGDVLAAQMNP